jgi:hypothetical protein
MIKRDYVHSDSGSVQITAPDATLFIYGDLTNLSHEELARVNMLSSAAEPELNFTSSFRDLLAEIKSSRATLLAFAGEQHVQSIHDNGVPGSKHRFTLRIHEGDDTADKVTFDFDLSKGSRDERGQVPTALGSSTTAAPGNHTFGTILLSSRIGQICTTLTENEIRHLHSELSIGALLVYRVNDKEETNIARSRTDLTEWKSVMMR